MVSFKEENTIAFKHLFLKGYSGVDEDDYSCSVYTQQDVYDSIFFAINQVSVLCVSMCYKQHEYCLKVTANKMLLSFHFLFWLVSFRLQMS